VARQRDVGSKPRVHRRAVAVGELRTRPSTRNAIRAHRVEKGDPLAAGELAGLLAMKRTSELIPHCHAIPLTASSVELELSRTGVRVRAQAETVDRTGVEMEALTAVSVAALALIDMIKAVDRAAVITDVRIEEKTGGKSGSWHRS
jgi:cyclic pyranopterin monophosphate synthase